VACGLADRFGAVVLSSDRIRKEPAGIDPTTGRRRLPRGPLLPRAHRELYTELLHRAESLLDRGEPVVLDASWTTRQHRRHAADTAIRTHSRLVQLECRARSVTPDLEKGPWTR
jgi:predicted kinase